MCGFRMITVIVPVVMDMLHGARRRFMDVRDAHDVIRIGEAWRSERAVGERERNGRHQHAKHVGERQNAPGQHSPRSRQSRQHRSPIITVRGGILRKFRLK
jgi:hypothetical protein